MIVVSIKDDNYHNLKGMVSRPVYCTRAILDSSFLIVSPEVKICAAGVDRGFRQSLIDFITERKEQSKDVIKVNMNEE